VEDAGHDALVTATVQTALGAMVDPSSKVQAAGCSAMSAISNCGGDEITPFLPQILAVAQHCFTIYGVKSSMVLLDTIGTLADSVGDALADPALSALYLPHVMKKVDSLEDDDMDIFPCLECLTSLCVAVGAEMAPYANPLFGRCLRIAAATIEANNATAEDAPSKDFAICAFDVIGGLFEGLGETFVASIVENAATAELVLRLIFASLQDDLPELRQSGFAISGEVCKFAGTLLTPPVVHQLVCDILRCLDLEHPVVINNAAWTLGELAIQVKLCGCVDRLTAAAEN
jgi:transportin-1